LNIQEGNYETLAGYLIAKFEKIPKRNEKLIIKNYTFSIKQVSHKKIEKILLKISNNKS